MKPCLFFIVFNFIPCLCYSQITTSNNWINPDLSAQDVKKLVRDRQQLSDLTDCLKEDNQILSKANNELVSKAAAIRAKANKTEKQNKELRNLNASFLVTIEQLNREAFGLKEFNNVLKNNLSSREQELKEVIELKKVIEERLKKAEESILDLTEELNYYKNLSSELENELLKKQAELLHTRLLLSIEGVNFFESTKKSSISISKTMTIKRNKILEIEVLYYLLPDEFQLIAPQELLVFLEIDGEQWSYRSDPFPIYSTGNVNTAYFKEIIGRNYMQTQRGILYKGIIELNLKERRVSRSVIKKSNIFGYKLKINSSIELHGILKIIN